MSGDDIARLAYIGILATMMAGGALALFRSNVKESLKMIGIWIIIGAVVMAGYLAYKG